MKHALITGINHYERAPLTGCVDDAARIGALLERHDDGSPNFFCQYLLSSQAEVTTQRLWAALKKLLLQPTELALFYFAGHGAENSLGGWLVTQSASKHQEGISLNQLVQLANNSPAKEVVIIVDACHSGHAGNILIEDHVTLREGVAVLCSSMKGQYSYERDGRGIFTNLLCQALSGGRADLLGNVSLAEIYGFAERLLNPWEQRPMLKANLCRPIHLRKCSSKLPVELLRKLPHYFPDPDHEYALSPEFEPTTQPSNPFLENILKEFQIYRSQGILEPVGTSHLYYAAMEGKSCQLTYFGKMYHQMATKGLL